MNGGEVFKFATRVIGESIEQALEKAGLTLEDVTLIVPHQANTRIIQAAARSLKVEPDIFMSNIDRYGNTSAASIPIALCEAIEKGRVHDNDYLAFVGFGGGLTWASMVVQWQAAHVLEPNRFNQRRRQLNYLITRWRAQLARNLRRFNQTLNRIRPKRGRIDRLRERVNREIPE
jgi:3-oxoacyl-[acyl-carrier-protein] synthase-3